MQIVNEVDLYFDTLYSRGVLTDYGGEYVTGTPNMERFISCLKTLKSKYCWFNTHKGQIRTMPLITTDSVNHEWNNLDRGWHDPISAVHQSIFLFQESQIKETLENIFDLDLVYEEAQIIQAACDNLIDSPFYRPAVRQLIADAVGVRDE